MQRINERFLARLKARSGSPAPFPGQYPTRVYAKWYDSTAGVIRCSTYVGKPVAHILARLRSPGRFSEFKEFDRKSLIVRLGGMQEFVNRRLLSLYHPSVLELPTDSGIGRLVYSSSFQLRYNDQGFVFYYPIGILTTQMVEKVRGLRADIPGKILAQRLAQAKQTGPRFYPPFVATTEEF